jgi:hypothetical protein
MPLTSRQTTFLQHKTPTMAQIPSELFKSICAFSAEYPSLKGGLPTDDPRTKKVKADLQDFALWAESKLKKAGHFGFRTAVAGGHGAFPRYTWVCFLPEGQKVVQGIYSGVCFDGEGKGAVAGCLKSVTRGEHELRTVTRDAEARRRIDVGDFNHAFVNPMEIQVDKFDEQGLLGHLVGSLTQAKDLVRRSAVTVVRDASSSEQSFAPVLASQSLQERIVLIATITKPFLILTGNSGTGKTKIAEQIANILSNADSSNWALVSVGADWTDSRSVVGFVNHLRNASATPWEGRPIYQSTPVLDLLLKADRNPDWPYFLILDEMNLSHVERYFADFLSAMEAKNGVIRLHSEGSGDDCRLPRSDEDDVGVPRSLRYPPNLFVIGTVNVDETTYMFSPKVLDRAHVMEFQVKDTDIEAFLNNPKEYATLPAAAEGDAQLFLKLSLRSRGSDKPDLDPLPAAVGKAVTGHLMALFRLLQKGRFEFAYRTANEVNRYLRVSREMCHDRTLWDAGGAVSNVDRDAGKNSWLSDLDDEILQKLLPRLHGSRSRLGPLLGALGCYAHVGRFEEALKFFPAEGEEMPTKGLQDLLLLNAGDVIFPRSFRKLRTMARVLTEEQFVSFIC